MSKNFKSTVIAVLSIIMLFSMVACKKGDTGINQTQDPQIQGETNYPYTIMDSRGEKVTFDKAPTKVVSMAPNITEIIYALGKGSSLVGRTDYCNYPEEVSKVASVGDIITPNVEKIVSLDPDLVLISGTTMPDSLNVLKDLGTKFVVINDQKDFDGVYNTIVNIGQILNAGNKANNITVAMKEKVEEIKAKVKDLNKPSTYYVVGYGEFGEYTATGDTFLGQMITMAGGNNIAKDATGWKFNLENIVSANPEVMIFSSMGGTVKDPNAALATANGYKDLKVVKEKKVYLINDDLVSRQGPRLAEGLEALAKAIHPDVFK
jgi:iron complex transport system substrate-binding protein